MNNCGDKNTLRSKLILTQSNTLQNPSLIKNKNNKNKSKEKTLYLNNIKNFNYNKPKISINNNPYSKNSKSIKESLSKSTFNNKDSLSPKMYRKEYYNKNSSSLSHYSTRDNFMNSSSRNNKIYFSPDFNRKIRPINIAVYNNESQNDYIFKNINNLYNKAYNNISKTKLSLREKSADCHMKSFNTSQKSIKNKNKKNDINYNQNMNKNIFSTDDLLKKVQKIRKYNDINTYSYDSNNNKNMNLSPKSTKNIDLKEKMNKKRINKILSDEDKEKFIIKIQSNFRRYALKKKLYNNVNLYMRYIKAIFILNKAMNKTYKNFFMQKLKKIFDDKIEKELIKYKLNKIKYDNIIEQIKKIQNKNYEIGQKYMELTSQIKDINLNKDKDLNINIKSNLVKTKSRRKRNNINYNDSKKNDIQNFFTIQNQINIIMDRPKNIIKKEVNIQNKNEKELKEYTNELTKLKSIHKNGKVKNKIKKDKLRGGKRREENSKIREPKEYENELKIVKELRNIDKMKKEEKKQIIKQKEKEINDIKRLKKDLKEKSSKLKEDKSKKEIFKNSKKLNEKNDKNNLKKENEKKIEMNLDLIAKINNRNKNKMQSNPAPVESSKEANDQNEYLQKKRSKIIRILLKNIVTKKISNYKENLQKFFFRYYYNVLNYSKSEEKNKKRNEDSINIINDNDSNKDSISENENENIDLKNKENGNDAQKYIENGIIINNEEINMKNNDEKKNNENSFNNKLDKNKINNSININANEEVNNKEKKYINDINNIEGDINDLKIEYKDKYLYSPEVLNIVKRNKHLRDLFYNKVRERQNYLHKCFIRFYYKGIMMQTIKNYEDKLLNSNINDTNTAPSINYSYTYNSNSHPYFSYNIINENNQNEENKNMLNIKNDNNDNNNNNVNNINNNSNNINNNNINESNDKGNINNNVNNANEANNLNNINDTNNNKESQNNNGEEKSESRKQLESAVSKLSNAQKLRKLLSQKNKQKLEILRKYFHKFNEGGIILSLRKSTKRSLLYKKIEGVDFEIALREVINNQAMNDIEVNDKTDEKEFKEAFDKKMLKDKRFSMQVEKVRFNSRKKKQLELEKIEESKKEKFKNLEIIFNKADRRNKVILKKYFEIYYLKSKVLSLSNYERRERRSKTTKVKRKTKKRSVIFNLDNNEVLDSNDILHRVNSGLKIGIENNNEEMENKSEQDDKNEKSYFMRSFHNAKLKILSFNKNFCIFHWTKNKNYVILQARVESF